MQKNVSKPAVACLSKVIFGGRNIFCMTKKNMYGPASSEEKRSLRKNSFQWVSKFESRFQQKDTMSFSRANFCIERNPDSSKYVTGIWNWIKRHLLEMNCSYLSMCEKD